MHRSNYKLILRTIFYVVAAIFLVFIIKKIREKPANQPEEGGKQKYIHITSDVDLIPDIKHELIFHKGFILSYSEKHEQAEWVAYLLTSQEVRGKVPRTNRFKEDPQVSTGSATPEDYLHSGYDRGHLAPAGDMKWDKQAMDESFYMSNISPQKPAFNRGIWKKLEEQVRQWALENDSIYVITGPVFSDSPETIGNSKVSVPAYFFKALMDVSYPTYKMIGFILPHQKSQAGLLTYAVSIDSLESFVNMDLFPALPDELENQLEKDFQPEMWKGIE